LPPTVSTTSSPSRNEGDRLLGAARQCFDDGGGLLVVLELDGLELDRDVLDLGDVDVLELLFLSLQIVL